jgi:putative ABC transport system permease protein
MTVTLLERTSEIGIMRALGGSRKDIQRVFLAESVIIGCLGGVAGVCLGILGGTLFNSGLNVLAHRLGGPEIRLFYYPIRFLLAIIAISTTIGFLSGIFPARRAAQLDPLEALRYK